MRFATKKEAERFIGDLQRPGRAATADRIPLEQWLATWIETHGPGWEARTRKDRAVYGDRWIVPRLGKMHLAELTRPAIRKWRADIRRDGATVYTANAAVRVLSAALGAAVKDDLLIANPCTGLDPIKREGVIRRRAAPALEVERIRAEIPGARDRAIVSLIAYAGLRPAEVRALRWEDVRERTLVVRAAIGSDGREKQTKSESIRAVPIIASLAADLAAVERVHERVVPGLNHDNWAMRVWRPARARVGSDAKPYDLRHTFASLLIREGLNAHEVARLLGHSTPALTWSTYGHLFAEAALGERQTMADAALHARAHACSVGVMARAS